MTDAVETAGRGPDAAGGPLLAPIRLAIGLAQGLALWTLHQTTEGGLTWPATVPTLFAPLALILLFVPILLLAGVGRMRWTTLAAWIAVATAILALMGWHEAARQSADALRHPPFFSGPMPVFAAAALFIGHHLVLPADLERRWIAAFPTYFDTAWKAAVQLALSIGFTGGFWLLLSLGASLFRIIGLDFLEDLIRKTWFFIPASTLVFSVAVHLTDVRDGLIRGVRAVGLMLLSWLLLVMTVLAAGFVLALPFTGLKGLWETGSATSLVLAAVGALIVLINAAYQDGRPETRPHLVLRLAVRVAAAVLVPLVVVAFWGLFLRIGQHGLTPDRIIALACAVVGTVFAGGYAWAAVRTLWREGDWMRPLEPTTLAGAALAFVLILALFSPLLDPARLSVADQVARLQRGVVPPDRFDFAFLGFESGKAGRAALDRLTRSANAEIARRARDAQADVERRESRIAPEPDRTPVFDVVPAGTRLPEGFVTQVSLDDPRFDCTALEACVATVRDLDRDGEAEVLIAGRTHISLWVRSERGVWGSRGTYQAGWCPGQERQDHRDLLRDPDLASAPARWPALVLPGGALAHLRMEPDCGVPVVAPPPVTVPPRRP